MNKTLIIAALGLLAAATTTFAAEATQDDPASYTSTLSRAEVRQDTQRASHTVLITQGEASVFDDTTVAGKSRAQVRAEARQAIRLGAIGHGHHDFIPTIAQLESIRLAGLAALDTMAAAR
jgi:hypothetical protein